MNKKRLIIALLIISCSVIFVFLSRNGRHAANTGEIRMQKEQGGAGNWQGKPDGTMGADDCVYGIFSWNREVLSMENPEELLLQYGITEIYQSIPLDSLTGQDGDVSAYLEHMEQAGIKVYCLVGEAAYGIAGGLEPLLAQIKAVADADERLKEDGRAGLAGIVLDIEPYLTDVWDEASEEGQHELFREYTDILCSAYAYAQERGLPFYPCIPYFYEKYNPQQLVRLIKDGGDGFLIMNYNRRDEYGQILTEVLLAEKYNKPITCIFELQAPGTHDLTEWNTYYQEGIEAVRASARTLYEAFGYEGLSFAYHYYDVLKEW